ncbi:MAG: xanthan lyase [Bacteroidaceae bacterium]|nr:xanthan lyase [Bacteroidaceae bacterium]
MRIERLLALVACLFCFYTLSAQSADKVLTRTLDKYFMEYKNDAFSMKNCRLERKRNNVVVNKRGRKITIYTNSNFAVQIFTPELVQKIYSDIRKILPKQYRRYKIEVIAHRKPIEHLIPNIYRKNKDLDYNRMLSSVDYETAPWVRNMSRPYTPTKGLQGRHLAIWQSHGRIFSNEKQMWQWQRPALYCTTEDLFTQSIVVPFLLPMMENAGALVYTPRERDWQPLSVVVDNDSKHEGAIYSEESARKVEWSDAGVGFKSREGYYVDGENPFMEGTSRLVPSSGDDENSTAMARWTPSIPADGRYAVYVSYPVLDNSVSDAHYTVLHAGGVTEFRVNQQMGGGTWVYLGTFSFNQGMSERQGVILDNACRGDGVVGADAVRFGGGMGVVARGDSVPVTSGMPRYLEGARYALQWSGFPYEVYSPSEGERDYNDDINSRSYALNHLVGGSVFNPDSAGLGVPLELSFGFHSDAGYSAEDTLIGSLGIVTTEYTGDTLATGLSRYISRDIVGSVLESVRDDINRRYGVEWACRGIIDKSYSESRLPVVPSMIFESLSHQNFIDMLYGHDPDFKFTVARAVYKALLKQLSFLRGKGYVVQPLPVKDFSIQFEGKKSVHLSWQPVEDILESTASPTCYILYTRVGSGGFDNGRIIDGTSVEVELVKNVQYSFKVAALNEGGESLSSEILTACRVSDEKGRVMIVNGFHRLSAPEAVSTVSKVGFEMDTDPGVSYMATPEYCGRQLDFERSNIGYENGLGMSGNDFESLLIAGNSFDYPYVHGRALAANGYSFVSCSSESVIDGAIHLDGYDAVDLILGVEKQGNKGSLLGYDRPYKTFPLPLQKALSDYCSHGGRLFVSGAHIASDMAKNDVDRNFIRTVLKFDFGGSSYNVSDDKIFGSNLRMQIRRSVNEYCYAVPRCDILVPVGANSFPSFVFDGSKESAGVAYAGDYRVISTSFPFEAIVDEHQRALLMGSVMRFLLK